MGWKPFVCFHPLTDLDEIEAIVNSLRRRGQTGGPQATSGSKPLVTKPAKLFVNLLQVITRSFTLFAPKD
jgi:hypothetical protein